MYKPKPISLVSKQDASLDHKFLEAVRAGNLLKIKGLVSQGADIHAQNSLGETALHIAGAANLTSLEKNTIANFLLDKGVDPCIDRRGGGVAAIHFTGSDQYLGVMDKMLKKGINVNVRTSVQETLLLLAGLNGADKLVELLLGYGANHDVKNGLGQNPRQIIFEVANRMEWTRGYRRVIDMLEAIEFYGIRPPYDSPKCLSMDTPPPAHYFTDCQSGQDIPIIARSCYTNHFLDVLPYLFENYSVPEVKTILSKVPYKFINRYKDDVREAYVQSYLNAKPKTEPAPIKRRRNTPKR